MIEFDNVKFPKDLSSKDGVWKEFLEIDSSGTFSKKKTSTPKTFLYFFLSQQVIRTSSKQNKFTFHTNF